MENGRGMGSQGQMFQKHECVHLGRRVERDRKLAYGVIGEP